MDNIEKQIGNLVGALTDPIIVMEPGWPVPDWIKEAMPLHRLAQNMKALQDPAEAEMATDLEAMAYLSNASLVAPMQSKWAEVYMYVFTQVMTRKGTEVPEDIRRDEISDHQKELLRDLKAWIYRQRSKVREERGKERRREEKEEKAARAPTMMRMF